VSPIENQKALFERIVQTAESLILVLDPRGRIEFFNRKVEELTGYKAEEVLGKEWISLFVPREYQRDCQRFLDSPSEEGPTPRRVQYPIISKEGKQIPIAWDRTLIRDQNGRTGAVLSVGHDLTGTNILEEERFGEIPEPDYLG